MLATWLGLAVFPILSVCQELSNANISTIKDRLADGAKQSWELGTRAEVLIELNATQFSVFSQSNKLPPPHTLPSGSNNSDLQAVFSIARSVVQGANITSPTGSTPLFVEGSAADPASVGNAVLLANWTNQSGAQFGAAAQNELNYLLFKAPKTSDGAISHRSDQVQLWSDFIYMVPPFLAYYGVLSGNQSLITESYNQIKLYRNYLRDPNASLWRHITMGSNADNGFWSTGNGWAAAGMLRVLATIQNSDFASSFGNELSDLKDWVKEIHTGMYGNLDKSNIFTNYATDPTSFHDASSTALLAATVYRYSLFVDDHTYVPQAENSRKALSASNSSGLVHFTSDGWLTPVVNPENMGTQGTQSPEGQAFVLSMQAAWNDWVADGSKGSGALRLLTNARWSCVCIILGLLLAM